MNNTNPIYIRKTLDEKLAPLKSFIGTTTPRKGWIRAIRNALGMQGKQLAERLNVVPSRISALEKSEWNGSITLKTLEQAAAALDCVLVYGIVPKDDLETIVRDQAEKHVKRKMQKVSHTMSLEDQSVSKKELDKYVESAVSSLVVKMPSALWDPVNEN